MRPTLLHFFTVVSFFSTAFSQILTAYANDFVDPDYILSKNFGDHTWRSRDSIQSWAKTLAGQGPWSVVNKAVTPPSGNMHDYMSWAPYWWPNCSGVGNTTVLTPEQVWKTCPYESRDGQFNPDVRQVNNVGDFQDFSEAVFYNTIAWALDTQDKAAYEANAVRFIRAWFLDEATRMTPNLIYGQMQRGPDGQIGSHTGILDLKAMAKVTTGILVLRKGKSTLWTTELDNQMISWAKEYITWLETAKIALEERDATNNHGSFYFNQIAALKILVNDLPGAKQVTNTYFDTLYMAQIVASGEQPLEAARTRPYHYRAYNLAAMITNARLEKYADPSSDVWAKVTKEGATIKSALDFALTTTAVVTGEGKYVRELYPNIAAVASVYGDTDGKYLNFMKNAYPGFMAEPFIFWNQPWAQNETSGYAPSLSPVVSATTGKLNSSKPTSTSTSTKKSGALSSKSGVFSFLATVLSLGLFVIDIVNETLYFFLPGIIDSLEGLFL